MNKILIKEIWFEEKDLIKNTVKDVKDGYNPFIMVLFDSR